MTDTLRTMKIETSRETDLTNYVFWRENYETATFYVHFVYDRCDLTNLFWRGNILILAFWRQCNLTEFFKGQKLEKLHRFWWTIWFDEFFFDNFRTARFPLMVRQCTNVTSAVLQPKPRMTWSSISTLNTNGQKMSPKHQNPNSTKSVKKCWFWRNYSKFNRNIFILIFWISRQN